MPKSSVVRTSLQKYLPLRRLSTDCLQSESENFLPLQKTKKGLQIELFIMLFNYWSNISICLQNRCTSGMILDVYYVCELAGAEYVYIKAIFII